MSPPDGNNGNGKVYADLTILTPNLSNLFTGFNPCDLVRNAPMLLDGLDGLLGTIQSGLANNVLNRTLPFVGDKLSQAANLTTVLVGIAALTGWGRRAYLRRKTRRTRA